MSLISPVLLCNYSTLKSIPSFQTAVSFLAAHKLPNRFGGFADSGTSVGRPNPSSEETSCPEKPGKCWHPRTLKGCREG